MRKPFLILLIVIAVIFAGITGKAFVQGFVKGYTGKLQDIKVEAALHTAETQINAKAPQMVDSITRLDGAKAGPGKQLRYNYTIITMKASEVDMENWRANMVPTVKKNAKDSEGLRPVFTAGVVVTYSYLGSDGKLIDDIVVTPEEVLGSQKKE